MAVCSVLPFNRSTSLLRQNPGRYEQNKRVLAPMFRPASHPMRRLARYANVGLKLNRSARHGCCGDARTCKRLRMRHLATT
jgi:hypothetical protein